MSLKKLPHIMDAWSQEDYESLMTAELERLQASMWNKMYRVELAMEQRTYPFYPRNKDKVIAHELARDAQDLKEEGKSFYTYYRWKVKKGKDLSV